MDDLIIVKALMVKSEINVHGGTSLVQLSHAEGNPNAVLRKANLGSLVVNSLLDAHAEGADLLPGA